MGSWEESLDSSSYAERFWILRDVGLLELLPLERIDAGQVRKLLWVVWNKATTWFASLKTQLLPWPFFCHIVKEAKRPLHRSEQITRRNLGFAAIKCMSWVSISAPRSQHYIFCYRATNQPAFTCIFIPEISNLFKKCNLAYIPCDFI